LKNKRLPGHGNKIKALWYVPFNILNNVGDNYYIHRLPPYMFIYSRVNVENLKLYEPTMVDQKEGQVLALIEKLALDD
jgi:hypothetical protein